MDRHPLLLAVLPRRPVRPAEDWTRPMVTALIGIWNGELEVAARVQNLLNQQYPADLLHIFIASDGSTDNTVGVVEALQLPQVTVRQFPRGGKSSAQNYAMREITSGIVVISDADTEFAPDCVEQLIAPFADPKVGCVTGTMISSGTGKPLSKDQGLYWRFENWIRHRESDAGILVTAAGACMAFRAELFRPLPPSRGDDCMIPLDVVLAGYRVVHTPLALAYDVFPSTLQGEFKARKRMTSRNLGGIFDRPALLNPLRYPGFAMSLWLHKIFRWLTPFFALAAVAASLPLALRHPTLLLPELLFFGFASLGYLCTVKERPAPRLAAACFSFFLANLGFAFGTVRWLRGEEITSYSNIRDTPAPPKRD